MVYPSSRPLTTYSRRRTRTRQPSQGASHSSPIRALSPDTDDVSFALMAERMNKRARLAAHSSTAEAGTTSVEEGRDDRPSKRTKALPVDHSQLTLGDDPMLDLPLHPNATTISEIDTYDKAPVAAHNRASSIPTFKPALDQTWLVPPKALSRSPPVADSDTEGDNLRRMDVDLEHPSFGRDAPLYISTPPRRQRSATVGAWAHGLMPQIDAEPPPPVHSFRYDSEVDMTDSSRPGSPTVTRPARVNPPRRRRRTIVHMSSDSLFSSSLDFSALMSETERLPRAPAQEGSRSPQETDEKWGPPAGADDSGIAFSTSGAPSIQPSSKGGRVRRKRGDTIRASDFAKLPASASFDGSSGSGLAAAPRPPPRRARSGTVTQVATTSTSGSGRRKHEGWPTIKMRTTAEPLRVDGDDADDELLLKDGDVVD
ncbi:hypothetical protein TRAPUB_12272 [Trametes pubescens]|uniref:Uncharacterized protein n=1 Tax=Trametes pubescens TaxID=154538 RepID=A0A1M2VUJ1_TRAPU|nr:hypothetical protein TRAPUB_12272 [Trametes pubescens]